MSALPQFVETFGIQPGAEFAVGANGQLAADEALAETEPAPYGRAKDTKLELVSRGRVATATFTSSGSILTVRGTCNKDGSYVCFSKQEKPRVSGPYEFVVEGHCIKVYQLKQLVWECGE